MITHWNINCLLKHSFTKLDDLVLGIFIIIFWMAINKVRLISTNNKILIHCSLFFFEKQRWINYLILDFSSVRAMVVYKERESNVLMLLQTYWDLELKVSSNSFEFFNIHIWLTRLLENRYPVQIIRRCTWSSVYNFVSNDPTFFSKKG
jgi:hypothetical protein